MFFFFCWQIANKRHDVTMALRHNTITTNSTTNRHTQHTILTWNSAGRRVPRLEFENDAVTVMFPCEIPFSACIKYTQIESNWVLHGQIYTKPNENSSTKWQKHYCTTSNGGVLKCTVPTDCKAKNDDFYPVIVPVYPQTSVLRQSIRVTFSE